MGGVSLCGQFCGTGGGSRQQLLRNKFKMQLKGSSFRSLCIEVLDNHFEEELQLQNEEFLRSSIAHGNHYETNSLISSVITEDSIIMRNSRKGSYEAEEDKLPTSIAGMPSLKKEAYILNLIRESYLFLDISECLQERKSIQSYERYMKHELLKDDQSLFQSFAVDATLIDRLEESLRYNHAEMTCLLEAYVHFCRKVKHDFIEEKERFLGKLSLHLQAAISSSYRQLEFKNRNDLILDLKEDIEEAIAILAMTIQTLYQIKIAPLTEQSEVTSSFNFYNEMNMHTMVTTLFFENQQFTDFVMGKVQECFSQRYFTFKRQPEYRTRDFIDDFVNLTCQGSLNNSRTRSQLTNLFDPESNKYDNLPIFENSRKILPKVIQKCQPLYKLKIVYELNRQMDRQMQRLKQALLDQHGIEVGSVFNRQIELLIVKWMLNQLRRNIDGIASHLLFTYFFIHRMYKIDKKGSCLTTFIQEVERIIKWTENQ